MRERINHFLNRPFPIFLANEKGRVYYFWMVVIFVVLANITKPFGFINWHEFHRSLVLTFYIGLFFSLYALVHQLFSYLRPHYYNSDTWTIRKEFQVLLFFFPILTGGTCLYADYTVPEFELTLDTFWDILLYNVTLSFLSVPTFGFFVDTKLVPTQPIQLTVFARAIEPIKPIELAQHIDPTLPVEPKENIKSKSHLTEEQAMKILHQLNGLMESEQLYLSKKCSIGYVATCSGIPKHRISEAINSFSDDTFRCFISRYRVEHACRLLENGKNKNLTIEAIGMDSGFESRSSFFNAFKMFTGKTTSVYLEELGKQTAPNPLKDNTAPNP